MGEIGWGNLVVKRIINYTVVGERKEELERREEGG